MKRLAALGVLLALPAAALDPRFSWETLVTPHFLIHYHQGMYRYAQRTARAAELSYQRLVPLLEHVPEDRTQVVVQDDTDFANGNASPLLYNLIHAYAAPPDSRSTLGDFDDNVYELISHEYTHILHLDTVLGLPQAVNDIFGKLWITNGGQPLWFIEGIATFAESEVSGSGRVRSSEEDMLVRAEVLAGVLPRIDTLSNVPLKWPRGFGQYTVGSRFLDWVRDEYGLGALRDLSHDYGARFIPFALNISAARVLGKTYLELYDEFAAFELNRADQLRGQVRAAGETRLEPLTRLGEWVRTPRFSADGATLYYTNAGPDRRAEIRAISPGGDRHVATLYSDGAGDSGIAVAPDGRVVFARAEVYQEFEGLQDLYSVDPITGTERRITRGLRARGPDVARDGAIAFVWRRPGGGTAIAELRAGEQTPRVLFEGPGGDPVDSPRWSPDGARVAFLHHRQGAWDVRIVDRATLAVSDVTRDRALDRDPAWTADGKWLLFSSDRTGIYDIYAWRPGEEPGSPRRGPEAGGRSMGEEPGSPRRRAEAGGRSMGDEPGSPRRRAEAGGRSMGEVRRVTNVVLGAFEPQPSPDGKQLALVTYSERGYDVARMPLDPDSWPAVEGDPVADSRPPVTVLPPEGAYPSRPYSPWETLRPHFWLPYAAADAYGSTVGALTAGFDAVDRHEYTAAVWWSIDGKEPGWNLSYLNRSFYPDLTLRLSRDLDSPQAAGGLNAKGFYYETSIGGSVTATFPFSQVAHSQAVSLTYELNHLSVHANPLGVATSPGLLAAATLAYSYSDARRFVNSISSEEGQRFSVAFRLSEPALGSEFSFWQLSTSASKFLLMPWNTGGVPWHHALALRASFGVSQGDLSNRHDFFLGGFQQGDPISSVLNPASAPLRILRGFLGDAFHGTAFALGTAEYRFPIWNVEVGAWTLPVYLRRLHGALYTDVGDAFSFDADDFKLHTGVGGELRAEVVLGWILPTDVRFGCAHGVERSPLAVLDCYAALGGVF